MSALEALLLPGTVESLAEILRELRDGVRIRGAGTWLDAGHRVQAAHELRLDAFRGVREYVPADLTISVGAATTLAELDAVTRAQGQYCPLLPWGTDEGTIGATLATASTGPFADTLGRPRDLVLGLDCVDGLGRIVRAGGRVVKNVAGFDLTRLMVGAWGTLGVITEAHLRLRALPTVDETWLLRGATADTLRAFARGPYAPLACFPLTPRLSAALGLGVESGWLLRIGGNARYVAAARDALAKFGTLSGSDAAAWALLRREAAPQPTAAHWRWDALSQRLKERFDPRGILNPGLLGAAS